MGVSIRALLEAGVKEGKIENEVLKKIEIKAKKQRAWFKPPEGRHSTEVEED